MKRYINLSTCSNFSQGDTVLTPEEIVKFAVEDGAKAVALTDLNSVHGFKDFSRAAEKYKDSGFKPIYGIKLYGIKHQEMDAPRIITLLVKNQVGLKNLYKIMSAGYMKKISNEHWPCISYEDIEENREGLFVGLECSVRDVLKIYNSDPKLNGEEWLNPLIENDYAIADYVEIKMWKEYKVDAIDWDDELGGKEYTIKKILGKIARRLQCTKKMVVAAMPINCITEQDKLCFDILHFHKKNSKATYFKTTEEMLEEYAFLDEFIFESEKKDLTEAAVLSNTNSIASAIENVVIGGTEFVPIKIENAEDTLKEKCADALQEKYGDTVSNFIRERYTSELENIIAKDFASYYILATMISDKSKDLGYLHNLRGCAGGSFILYLLGVTEINPLVPHYYCPKCKRVELVDINEFPSGFDLNRRDILDVKLCPSCGEKMIGDGHNIPVEFFAGFSGEKVPDIDFNLAPNIKENVSEYLSEVFGKDKIIAACTCGRYSNKKAETMIDSYCYENPEQLNHFDKKSICKRLSNVFRCNGRYPGGVYIIPRDREIYDFTPVGFTSLFEMENSYRPLSLIEYHNSPLDKVDILCHDMFSKLKSLETFTGVPASTIDFGEIDIFSFFTDGEFGGLPYDNGFARKVVDVTAPCRFSDLVRISGFSHGVGVWHDNAENLVGEVCNQEEVIASREDVMLTLKRHGLSQKAAFMIAEQVRKGKIHQNGWSKEQLKLLQEHEVPEWLIESIQKILYLFPKSHAVGYVMNYLRMIWYKIFHPVAFYSVAFSYSLVPCFDYSILSKGKARIELELNRFEMKCGSDYNSGTDEGWKENEKQFLELALECNKKGIAFLPIDLNLSDAEEFIPENGAIRLPYNFPEHYEPIIIQKIEEERKLQKFTSREDFINRIRPNKDTIAEMDKSNLFDTLNNDPQPKINKIGKAVNSLMT